MTEETPDFEAAKERPLDEPGEEYEPDHAAAYRDARNIAENFEPQDCDENEYNLARAYLAQAARIKQDRVRIAELEARVDSILIRHRANHGDGRSRTCRDCCDARDALARKEPPDA